MNEDIKFHISGSGYIHSTHTYKSQIYIHSCGFTTLSHHDDVVELTEYTGAYIARNDFQQIQYTPYTIPRLDPFYLILYQHFTMQWIVFFFCFVILLCETLRWFSVIFGVNQIILRVHIFVIFAQ